QLLDELDALEFHQLRVPLDAAIQREADLPRLRERIGILDRRLVHQVILRDARVTLGDLQFRRREIARAIEPGLTIHAGRGDDERLAFPAAHRLPHPGIDRRLAGILEVHVPHGARPWPTTGATSTPIPITTVQAIKPARNAFRMLKDTSASAAKYTATTRDVKNVQSLHTVLGARCSARPGRSRILYPHYWRA